MKIKHFITICIVLFLSTKVRSQEKFIIGYIISEDIDTIQGLIKDRKPEPFEKIFKKIKFKSKKSRRRRYGPNDILGYKIGQEEFVSMWFSESAVYFKYKVESVPNKGEKIFIKLKAKGYLSYYHLEYIDDSGLNNRGFFKRDDEDAMVFVRTGLFGLNRKRLNTYFNDCPTLQNKIQDKTITDPYDIVNFYNQWYDKTKLD
jgi:hypothetical protein